MNAALEFELLKARRAGVFRWGAVVVAVGVPALSTAFFELVRLGGDSPSAAKAATMITDLSLAGLLGTAGQVLSVAILMTAGIAASWSFGREFVDDALPALFAIATPRSSVAAAKFVVLAGWALLTVVSTVILTVVGGLLVGLDMDAAAVQTASRVAAAGLLGAALAAPMALVSSWRRGYLPGIIALVALVVVTQLVTAIGAGAWFPYAAPALWMGMGGAPPPARCQQSSCCYRSSLRRWRFSRRSAGGGAPRRVEQCPPRARQTAIFFSVHARCTGFLWSRWGSPRHRQTRQITFCRGRPNHRTTTLRWSRGTGVSAPVRHSSATTLKLLDEMSQLSQGHQLGAAVLMDVRHDTFVE